MSKSGKIFEYTGVVDKVCDVEVFSNGKFRKQTLVVGADIDDEESKYPPHNPFEFKNEHVNDLIGVKKGMRVKVVFVLDGRSWSDPRTGKEKFFAGCTAFKCQKLTADGSANVPEPATPDVEANDNGDDEMPF